MLKPGQKNNYQEFLRKKKKVAVAMSPRKSLRDWAGQAGAPKKRIIMAMSGGVDSSVAAKLLVDQGHEVIGIFLHFWKEENPPSPPATSAGQALCPPQKRGGQGGSFENKCCSTDALLDARRVCDKIGIPLYTLNFAKIFKRQVVDNFLNEYKKGKTPNPCVRCNKLVKLGYLIKQAKKLGFDYVASGHYVRNYELRQPKVSCQRQTRGQPLAEITNYEFKYKLLKAKDKSKDQSYFLYTLNQKELAHLLFPLGDYTKLQVRRLAKKFKLPVAEKAESQEICFIPGKSHNEFLKRHLKLKPGQIRTFDGKIVGSHLGLPLYTIGQRKGIAIGGSGPFYAAKMDYQTNTLYVADNGNDKILYNNKLIANNVNWVAGIEPKLPFLSDAVIRYRHKPAQGVISKISKNKYQVKFVQSPRAITSGQSVVFYKIRQPERRGDQANYVNNEEVLGGGIICQN